MLPETLSRVNSIVMLNPDVPLTVAEIARAAELKYTPTDSALATLEKRGVINRVTRAGHAAFEPNRESPHYPVAYLAALVDLPLSAALRPARIAAVFVYGSLSRPGGGGPGSDLDLLIVGDVKDRPGLVERLALVGARLGRAIDPVILSPEQFEQARRREEPHVMSALGGVRILGAL